MSQYPQQPLFTSSNQRELRLSKRMLAKIYKKDWVLGKILSIKDMGIYKIEQCK